MFLMGYGLVDLPRGLWNNANCSLMLQRCVARFPAGASWVTLKILVCDAARARWVTLRASCVTLRARWVRASVRTKTLTDFVCWYVCLSRSHQYVAELAQALADAHSVRPSQTILLSVSCIFNSNKPD